MTITTRQQSSKKSNNNLNMTKHPPPTPGLLLQSSQDDHSNHDNNYIQQLPLPPTQFNMHHDLHSSNQPHINLGTNATTNTSNSSAIIWDYLMAQVKVQLRTMPRDESFFSRGLELQSLVRSEVGICSSKHDRLNGGMEPMTALQSQAVVSVGSRGYQQQQQQHPLSYAVSSTSFVSISPMRTFKQLRGSMYATSQQHQLLPSTENVGVGMMKQHVYHHASSAEDTPITSNKMNRTTSSHNQVDTSVSFCQCHPSCREISNPYGTTLYLQDSPTDNKTEVSSTPLVLGKKMGGTYTNNNPTIQEQLNFSASKKDTNTNSTSNTTTNSTSPPGQLYLHDAGLSSATSTPLHDKFVFSDMTEIDPSSTGISSPSKKKAGSTKVASKWSEVPFKAKKKKTKVKSSSRTVKKVSSAAKKVDPKPALKKKTNVKSSAAKKVSPKRATRDSKKASTLSIVSPTDVDVLCGRGGMTTIHKGNVRFRDYVSQMRGAYRQARKVDKKALSEEVVNKVKADGGRFLRSVGDGSSWYEITDEDARLKTTQCLREIKVV